MSLTATIEALVEAGATPEMLLAVVRRHEQERDRELAERREKEAQRKRDARAAASAMSADVRGRDRTSAVSSPHVHERSARVVTPFSSSLRSEEGKEPPPNPNGLGAPKGAETARGSRIPENWSPVPDYEPEAYGLSQAQHDAELTKFLDYWRSVPGAKGRKSDWPATWRNWMRRAAENSTRKPSHERNHHHPNPTSREDRLGRMLRGAMAAVDEREPGMG